jgi:NTE family protein
MIIIRIDGGAGAHSSTRRVCAVLLLALLAGCAVRPSPGTVPPAPPGPTVPLPQPIPEPVSVAPRVGLALGGGAARGFAHVGVINVLEQAGIVPEVVSGTSAGAVVGAIHAAGYRSADLLRIATQLEQSDVRDLTLPDRGFVRGERLQAFINRAVQNRPIERLNLRFVAVATDLQTGDAVLLRSGDAGLAVRASSAVPGVFQPVVFGERQLVDGGLTHPVPVRAARALGAELVIAVDISSQPQAGRLVSSIDVLLQTFAIMGRGLAARELAEADVVIRPAISQIKSNDFDSRQVAIAEGERAARDALPEIRRRIEALTRRISPPAGEPRRSG